MFEEVMHYYVFCFLCFNNQILTDMFEDNWREEGDTNLELEEGFIISGYKENI